MHYASDLPRFSAEQIQQQLTIAFQEVSCSPDKCVYLTNIGIQALSTKDAKINDSAKLIDPYKPQQALPLILSRFSETTSNKNSYEKAAQTFANVLQKNAKQNQPTTFHRDVKGDQQPKSLRIHLKQEAPKRDKKESASVNYGDGQKKTLDIDRLKHTAEIEGFGYKKANLDQISELCKERFGDYEVEVPAYAGLTSNVIQSMLKDKCNLNVADKWRSIIEKHFPLNLPEIREEAMKSKKFPEAFFTDCALLRKEITDAFASLSLRAKEGNDLNILFGVNNLNSLIDEVQGQNERLMVRSTGKEDTKELANAGGNTSVANVTPSFQNILEATAEVITSYFDEKSLKQRLGANDSSLFDITALTPVLNQKMVGNSNLLALSKCGVMFTEDSESRLLDPLTENATSGITVIQSANGHNHGVVNSLIAVDTYFINNERVVFPIIRPKTHSVVPTQKSGELRLEANHPTFISASSLSLSAIETLKNFSERLEEFYSGPMDVEFIVDEEKKKIFIVQARPIIHSSGAAAACYIPDPKKLNTSEILKGTAIGVAGGGLRLGKPHELIVDVDISKALDQYQSCDNPSIIKAIIVAKMAPSTSHWATIFRNEGKPVVNIDQLETVQSWLENSEANILISPQQGLVANIEAESLEELEANGSCAGGWVDYPAASLFSSCSEFQLTEKLTDVAIKEICPALSNPTKWEIFKINAGKAKLQEVFKAIRNSQGEELKLHLAVLLFLFMNAHEHRKGILELDEVQQNRLESLQNNALVLAKSIRDNGDYEPHDSNYSCKLLPIHFLESLVYSQASPNEVINGDSLAFDLREIEEEQELVSKLQKEDVILTNPYSIPLLRLERFAFAPETAQLFRNFVIELDHLGRSDSLKSLSALINNLNKLDMLVPWLNLIFPNDPTIFGHLEAFAVQAPFYMELKEKSEILNTLNVSAFSYKNSFKTQWQILNSELLDFIKSNDFIEKYNKGDYVSGKLAALALMNKLVDQFDLAIKALEGSSKDEFTIEEKLKLFQEMLISYCDLAVRWCNSFKFNKAMKTRIAERLMKTLEILKKTNLSATDLRFSQYFDLLGFGSLSSSTLGRVVAPVSLEDAFSAIHRELLTILNLMNINLGINLQVSPLLSSITQKLTNVLGNFSGMELNVSGVTTYYTQTLREHGVQFRLHQAIGAEKVSLSVRFSAENENKRWDRILHFMIFLKIHGKFDLSEFELGGRGCGFTFHIDDNDNLQTLRDLIATIESLSSAMPGAGVQTPPLSTINNDKKGLVPLMDDQRIVKEFEKVCGMASMMTNYDLQTHLKRAMHKDLSFAESFLKKAWKVEMMDTTVSYNIDNLYPKFLISKGHALGPISLRGMELIESGYSDNRHSGIQLLLSVAEKKPDALPAGCSWQAFRVLLNKNSSSWLVGKDDHSAAKIILDYLKHKHTEIEVIQSKLISELTSSEVSKRDYGIKVLNLLQTKYPNYLTPVFKEKLIEVTNQSADEATKLNLLEKLKLWP